MIRVGLRWLARGSCRHPEIMTMAGGSLCAVDFPAMVGIIDHPVRGTLLFDTGYDPAFLAATQPFPERFYRWTTPVQIGAAQSWSTWLADSGIDPDSIAGTILSHFHGDHVAGMVHLADRPIHCARAGLEALRRPGRIRQLRSGHLAALVPKTADAHARFFEDAPAVQLPAAFAPFAEGRDILGDGSLLAVELPGHCAGHWGLALRTQDDRDVLLAADAVWAGKAIDLRRAPPMLTTALLGQTRPYRETLHRLHAARCNNADLVILPSHCAHSAAAFNAD
ncbi:MBL fold metallo-hydrolase [Novosphingobium sp.]|uniref:MBL fold metallo-hydrolase n=1 Tax=Novosphingobium sp. TaxID=1874826 RepID=UPI0025DA06BC|nr:MBL fold metallo-hydrolase [Novosphingobium sp.]